MPRISVVLCTYQGAAFLSQQLESLLSQTRAVDELIVCDDRSDDATVEIVRKLQVAAPFPVHLLVNPRNLGSTRNFDQALELATGDYLALCDQDDIWFPEKLDSLANVLDEDPTVGGVFSDATLMDSRGTPLRSGLSKSNCQTLWTVFQFDRMKQRAFLDNGPIDLLLKHDVVTGATLMVRANARRFWHPIPTSWIHDGWIAWMLAVNSRLAFVPRPLMYYRVHAQQQVGVGKIAMLKRLDQLRRVERARYSKRADSFQDLRDRIAAAKPLDKELIKTLETKIELLRRRAALPRSFPRRLLMILADAKNYRRYARGWRSMRKDVLLF